MPDTSSATIEAAIALLREGRVQEADDLLTAHKSTTPAGGAPAPAPAPTPPRAPITIIADILVAISMLLGNAGPLEALLAELMLSL